MKKLKGIDTFNNINPNLKSVTLARRGDLCLQQQHLRGIDKRIKTSLSYRVREKTVWDMYVYVCVCMWCIYGPISEDKNKIKKIILSTFKLTYSLTIPFTYIIHSGHTHPWALFSPPMLINAPFLPPSPYHTFMSYCFCLWPLALTRATCLVTGAALPPEAWLTRKMTLTLQCLYFTIRIPRRTDSQGLLKAGLLALHSLQLLPPSTTFSLPCPQSIFPLVSMR